MFLCTPIVAVPDCRLFCQLVMHTDNPRWSDRITEHTDLEGTVKKHLWLLTGWLTLGLIILPTVDAQDRMSRGMSYEETMRWSEAISEYTALLKEEPEHVEARYRLGIVYEKLGAIDDSLKWHKEVLQRDATHSGAREALAGYYIKRGVELRRNNKPAEAAQMFQQALQYNADSASAHFELGQELAKTGHKEQAIQSYKQAIQLDPDMSAAYTQLGTVYTDMGNYPEAMRAYEHVVRLNPDDPAAHYGLGVAYSETGERDKAIATLEKSWKNYLKLGRRDLAKPAFDLQNKLKAEKAAGTTD